MIRSRLAERFGDSFTLRVFLYLVGPVILISAGFVGVHLDRERVRVSQEFTERSESLIRLFAHSARLGLFSADREALRALTGSLLSQGVYLSVRVFDADRQLLLQSDVRTPLPGPDQAALEDWASQHPPADELLAVADQQGRLLLRRRPDHVEFWLTVRSRPEYQHVEDLYYEDSAESGEGPVLGYLGILASRAGPRATVRDEARRYVALTVLFLTVGAIVSLLVVSEATRPLRSLVRQVRGGDDDAAASSGGIDLISARFAALVDELDTAFGTIRQLNRGLETRVAERTTELASANAHLVHEMEERREAQRALQRAHDELEDRVKERTAELEQTHAQLRHAEKLAAIGRLSASLAHEFNNPICGVRNCIEELRHDLSPESEEAEIAALALAECDRMAYLIANLRQLSRPSPDQVAAVDAATAVAAMLRLTQKEFDRAGIRVIPEFEPDLPPVRLPEDQFKQVLLNLLQNARDAMDGGGGHVYVRVRGAAERIAVEVRDEGVGISPEELPHIFEPFYSTKDAVKGTGLGLSVSYGIVERFGGDIHVVSSPGEGSTFTLWLPAAEDVT